MKILEENTEPWREDLVEQYFFASVHEHSPREMVNFAVWVCTHTLNIACPLFVCQSLRSIGEVPLENCLSARNSGGGLWRSGRTSNEERVNPPSIELDHLRDPPGHPSLAHLRHSYWMAVSQGRCAAYFCALLSARNGSVVLEEATQLAKYYSCFAFSPYRRPTCCDYIEECLENKNSIGYHIWSH